MKLNTKRLNRLNESSGDLDTLTDHYWDILTPKQQIFVNAQLAIVVDVLGLAIANFPPKD